MYRSPRMVNIMLMTDSSILQHDVMVLCSRINLCCPLRRFLRVWKKRIERVIECITRHLLLSLYNWLQNCYGFMEEKLNLHRLEFFLAIWHVCLSIAAGWHGKEVLFWHFFHSKPLYKFADNCSISIDASSLLTSLPAEVDKEWRKPSQKTNVCFSGKPVCLNTIHGYLRVDAFKLMSYLEGLQIHFIMIWYF